MNEYKLVNDKGEVYSVDGQELHYVNKESALRALHDTDSKEGWFIVPKDWVYTRCMGGNGYAWTTPGQRG